MYSRSERKVRAVRTCQVALNRPVADEQVVSLVFVFLPNIKLLKNRRHLSITTGVIDCVTQDMTCSRTADLLAVFQTVLHSLQRLHDLRLGCRLVFLVVESRLQKRHQKLDSFRLQSLNNNNNNRVESCDVTRHTVR